MRGKAHCFDVQCKLSRNSMHLSHSVNRVGSQLQPELGYMHPPFLKYATKVKLSTGAGLLVLVRDGTRYLLKMVIGTS